MSKRYKRNDKGSNNNTMQMVMCRLCGEAWRVPNYIASTISASRPYECPYCQKKLASKYGAMIYTN